MARKPADVGQQFGLASDPRMPAPWDKETAYAVRALYEGKANESQQRRVAAFIERAAGVYDLEFRPDERMSSFASGKRFVGLQVRKLATLNPEIIDAIATASKQTGD